MPIEIIEVDTSKIGLIPGTDNQVGGDIWHLFTKIPKGAQGSWSARVGCNQEYPSCPVKRGSKGIKGIICDAVNTDRSVWETDGLEVPLSGAVYCGKAPLIQSSLEAAKPTVA